MLLQSLILKTLKLMIERDKKNIWHPFSPQKGGAELIHIERAEGAYLYTSDGRRLLDAIASWWVNIHGHGHPAIAKAIADQALKLDHVLFAGFTHTPAIELAEKLLDALTPSFSKIFYSDNGSTAVEVALKMALQYFFNKGIKGKNRIIAFENAYHGDTFGAMSAGGRSVFNAPFQDLLFDVVHIPTPNADNLTESLAQFEAAAKKGDVAAFIFEPLVQGASGMLMYEAADLDKILAIAKTYNIVCIADEVMTGFGRTGKTFATDYLNQKPDIICLSKGITGGFLPLGVTACNTKLYSAFDSEDKMKTFYHGHSYTANPIACAAAVASIDILRGPDCQDQISMICREHAVFLEKMKNHRQIKNIRQTGTILAIEIETPTETSYFNEIKTIITPFFLENEIIIRPLGNIVYLMPPYCISASQLKFIYETMENALIFLEKKIASAIP
jgi:adenosylmethionine---8-amino-7-oxononanoate aminotransferase